MSDEQTEERAERLAAENHRLGQRNLHLERECQRMQRILGARDAKTNLVRDEVAELDTFARLRNQRELLRDAATRAYHMIGNGDYREAQEAINVALHRLDAAMAKGES